jgi:hypothetical protein
VFVSGTPESPIPDFPKRLISQHVTSLNRTVHNCSGVSTLDSPDPLSSGILILRFPISRNGRSHDTWPPSIGWLRPIPGFPQWKVPISCQQESRFRDSRFPGMGDLYDTWPPLIGWLRPIPGFPQWKVPISCQQESRFRDSRFPVMGDLMTRGLRQSDGSDLSRGFHNGKSRTLVNRNPDSRFLISRGLQWEILRHNGLRQSDDFPELDLWKVSGVFRPYTLGS